MNNERTENYVAGADVQKDFVEIMNLPPGLEQKMTERIRMSFSLSDNGDVEIYSCQTKTTLFLPMNDVDLLIENLKNFHQTESPRETIFLDPSS